MTAPFTMALPLDRVTAIAIEPGARFEVHGRVVASLDGTSFDAARLFDFAAGGLRVVDAAPDRFAYVLEATGEDAPACATAGAPAPCLIPRLATLAHERLRTETELASTLSGSLELEARTASSVSSGAGSFLSRGVAGACLVVVFVWLALTLSRRAGQTSMGRVRIAARRALRAIHGDATLEPVRQRIRALVDRARAVDAVRITSTRTLSRVDRAALDRRAHALAAAAVPQAAAASASIEAERAEVARLETERVSAVVELERIESALRVVALRARSRVALDAQPGARGPDAIDALIGELDLRDQAVAEAEMH
ncbi:MAG TPA: hypothetical protein VH044_08765 [Polyangiaceae bacterium]|jgi:hypothetical protein|nr:hypothetical protein [Polyangiaceae bacterium]